ncbi:MAG: hypothetical protein GY769_11095 [bacterium]|nr:hypothetical protein [bacterium]
MKDSRALTVVWALGTAALLLMPGHNLPEAGLSEALEAVIELGVHFILFFGLSFLAAHGYAGPGQEAGRRSRLIAALLAYCVLLEILQIAVPGRNLEFPDLAVGMLGVLLGFKRGS